MNWFIALKQSFFSSLLLHQSLVNLCCSQLVLPLLTDLYVFIMLVVRESMLGLLQSEEGQRPPIK